MQPQQLTRLFLRIILSVLLLFTGIEQLNPFTGFSFGQMNHLNPLMDILPFEYQILFGVIKGAAALILFIPRLIPFILLMMAPLTISSFLLHLGSGASNTGITSAVMILNLYIMTGYLNQYKMLFRKQ
jgi:hypothetical protein